MVLSCGFNSKVICIAVISWNLFRYVFFKFSQKYKTLNVVVVDMCHLVMESGFGSLGQGSISNVTKDPSSACGVRVCKISWFRKSHGQIASKFTMGIASGEKFQSPVKEISKLWRWRWMLLPSIVRGRNRTPAIVKMRLPSHE